MLGLYLTHPEVMVKPGIPVTDWSLSAAGLARVRAFSARPWLAAFRRVIASPERKAQETATVLARAIGVPVETAAGMGENDRSATGYLPGPQFEAAADAFFAHPEISFEGWETASAAQARVVGAIGRALSGHDLYAPVIFVGHGAVGTLLRQAMAGEPISRAGDQFPGGGCVFRFGLPFGPVQGGWQRMEDVAFATPEFAHLLAPGLRNASGKTGKF